MPARHGFESAPRPRELVEPREDDRPEPEEGVGEGARPPRPRQRSAESGLALAARPRVEGADDGRLARLVAGERERPALAERDELADDGRRDAGDMLRGRTFSREYGDL